METSMRNRIPQAGVALLLSVLALAAASPVRADIVVGGTFTATGPNTPIGAPGKNAFAIFPETIAGQHVKYIGLDDACDSTLAAKNMRKLTEEDKLYARLPGDGRCGAGKKNRPGLPRATAAT